MRMNKQVGTFTDPDGAAHVYWKPVARVYYLPWKLLSESNAIKAYSNALTLFNSDLTLFNSEVYTGVSADIATTILAGVVQRYQQLAPAGPIPEDTPLSVYTPPVEGYAYHSPYFATLNRQDTTLPAGDAPFPCKCCVFGRDSFEALVVSRHRLSLHLKHIAQQVNSSSAKINTDKWLYQLAKLSGVLVEFNAMYHHIKWGHFRAMGVEGKAALSARLKTIPVPNCRFKTPSKDRTDPAMKDRTV